MKIVKTPIPAQEILSIKGDAGLKPEIVISFIDTSGKFQIMNIPGLRIDGLKKCKDGTFVFLQEMKEEKDVIALIDAESLSMDEAFMQHMPVNQTEEYLKECISEAITKGTKNFYRFTCDPSFTDNRDGICFSPDFKKPAIGCSYNWWVDVAKKYDPKRNTRLGTRLEYFAFIGILMRKLVESGLSVETVWDTVCHKAQSLGVFSKMDEMTPLHWAKYTGTCEVCGFYDLANTEKFVADDTNPNVFYSVSSYNITSLGYASIVATYKCTGDYDFPWRNNVGWIVFS